MDGFASRLEKEVATLQAGLQEMRSSLQNLTLVVQGEQDRGAAADAATATDRANLEELGKRLTVLQRRMDGDHRLSHSVRGEIQTVDGRLESTRGQLGDQGIKLESAIKRVELLEKSVCVAQVRLEHLDEVTQSLGGRLDVSQNTVREHAAQHVSCNNRLDQLKVQLQDAETRAVQLSAAHDETVNTLCGVRDSLVAPAIEKAEVERIRLDGAVARLIAVESREALLAEDTSQLSTSVQKLDVDINDLQTLLNDATSRVSSLDGALKEVNAQAETEHERLHTTEHQIGVLQADAKEAGTELRSLRAEVTALKSIDQQHQARVDVLVGRVAALGHGVENTDEEIGGLRDHLNAPRLPR